MQVHTSFFCIFLFSVCCSSVVLCHRRIFVCFYICLSPFPECSEAPLGEGRVFVVRLLAVLCHRRIVCYMVISQSQYSYQRKRYLFL